MKMNLYHCFLVLVLAWNIDAGIIFKRLLRKGTGAIPQTNQRVSVHYTGTLKSNGKEFDTSRGGNPPKPFTFTLGVGEVISGWDYAVANMTVGERAEFEIPPEYAYRAQGAPPEYPFT